MIYTIQYTDTVSRQTALNNNATKFLIEERNLFTGNFLIFTDVKPLENQIMDLQQLLNVAPPVANPVTLLDYQTNKIAQITDLCNQKLAAGFTSSASGALVKYGYGASEQTSFDDLSTMDFRGWVVYPFNVYAQDGTPVSITTKAQLDQLFKDIFLFKYPLKTKQHDFINQVNACTTVAQVNTIVVVF